jgi:hypothetical protein
VSTAAHFGYSITYTHLAYEDDAEATVVHKKEHIPHLHAVQGHILSKVEELEPHLVSREFATEALAESTPCLKNMRTINDNSESSFLGPM